MSGAATRKVRVRPVRALAADGGGWASRMDGCSRAELDEQMRVKREMDARARTIAARASAARPWRCLRSLASTAEENTYYDRGTGVRELSRRDGSRGVGDHVTHRDVMHGSFAGA